MIEPDFMRYTYIEWFFLISVFFGLVLWLHLKLIKEGFFFNRTEEQKSNQKAITILSWIAILELFSQLPFYFVTYTFSISSNLGMLISPIILSYSIIVIDRVMLKGLYKGIFGIISFILAVPYILFTILDTFYFFDSPPPYITYVALIRYVFFGFFLILIISMIILARRHKFDKKICIFTVLSLSFMRIIPALYYSLKFLIFGPSDVNNLFLDMFITQTVTFVSNIVGFVFLVLAILAYALDLKSKS